MRKNRHSIGRYFAASKCPSEVFFFNTAVLSCCKVIGWRCVYLTSHSDNWKTVLYSNMRLLGGKCKGLKDLKTLFWRGIQIIQHYQREIYASGGSSFRIDPSAFACDAIKSETKLTSRSREVLTMLRNDKPFTKARSHSWPHFFLLSAPNFHYYDSFHDSRDDNIEINSSVWVF